MLIALRNGAPHGGGVRTEAALAERGTPHICPECRLPVLLKRGDFKIPHFAHRALVSGCDNNGETTEHLAGKAAFLSEFRSRLGWQAEAEVRLPEVGRRADVLITDPSGRRYAIEVQHTTISLYEIMGRTVSYLEAGIVPIWVALMPAWETDTGRYSAPPWQRWASGLTHGQLAFFEPESALLWDGKLGAVGLYVPQTDWGGGYVKQSKRWKRLTLSNPRPIERVGIALRQRTSHGLGIYSWPAGWVASLANHTPPAARHGVTPDRAQEPVA